MKPINYILSLIFIISSGCMYSQQKERQVTFNGNIGLFFDTYNYSEENFSTFRPKYPENELRLNANATLQIGEYLSIPFGINISNQNRNFTFHVYFHIGI